MDGWEVGSTERGNQDSVCGKSGEGSKDSFLEQEALAGFPWGRGMPALSSCSISLYIFTHSIRLIREWFWASSNTCLGLPTSMVP